MTINRKPTRGQLLKVVHQLQILIGQAKTFHGNDRNPHGFEEGQKSLERAFNLCIEAQSFDPPVGL